MKTIRLITAIIFAIFISAPYVSGAANTYVGAKDSSLGKNNQISMDFQDANLKTVLKVFSQQSGLNFIASQNVQDRTVTVYFDNVKVEDALNYLMNANSLIYEQESGTNIFIVKETGKPEIETITKIYELKYAQLSAPAKKSAGSAEQDSTKASSGSEGGKSGEAEIISILQNILSKNGKVVADKRSNSLIIRDVPSQFPIIEDLLARLDVRTPQVRIKVEVLETTTKLIESLGINWADGIFGIYTGPVVNTIWPMNNNLGRNFPSGTSGEVIKTAGTFSMASTSGTITALINNSDTKILARPQVMTMNNETARIELSSKEKASKTTTTSAVGNSGSTTGDTYEEKDTGVILEVTPQISKDGYITMNLKPSFTELELSRFTNAYDVHKRATETTVMIKDGETVVIGGLIKSKNEHGLKKVPFLGDIPILGAAFRYKTQNDQDRELIIFITPSIVKDISYALGNISEREQEKPKAVREKEVNTVLDLFGG
ncbi:MAG: secretin N-terminal domain-containing protein [Candidatus Omnitrophota bacterium]|nr:secretin N-terminal domain-containing protein [Candidatus Omnitrophota bacterium]